MSPRKDRPKPVAAKLVRPCTDDIVLRATTADAFEAALSRRLTLVLAPAGYGKSCATAAVLQRTCRDSAWYKLDLLDRDPVMLLTGITHAMRTVHRDFGEVLLERLHTATQTPFPVARMTAAFVEECAAWCESDLCLVLDDYHETADSDALNRALDHLLAYAPPQLHFVVLSRYEPEFATAKLRLADEIGAVRAGQLRLETAQAAAVLEQRTGRTWGGDDLARVIDVTEGWPASIVLAGMALEWLDLDSIEATLADPRLKGDIYSYLAEQVFQRESQSTRSFLLRTCFLETITAGLAGRLADPQTADRHLEHLARNHIFTFPAAEEGGYRYHKLFQEFLRLKCLSEAGQSAFHELQCATATALEAAGDLERAVELVLSANEPLRALQTIARGGEPGLETSPSDRLRDWLDRLPPQLRSEHSWANLIAAQLLMREGHFEAALERADRAIGQIHPDDELSLYHALSIKECTYFWKGDIEKSANTSEDALAHAQNDQQRIHSLISLGAAALEMRDWARADAAHSKAEELLAGARNIEALRLAILRSHSAYLRGDIRAAQSKVVLLDGETAPANLRIPLLGMRGMIEMGLGNLATALRCFESALHVSSAHGDALQCHLIRDSLGVCLASAGASTRGLEEVRSACDSSLVQSDSSMHALTLSHSGTLLRRQGDLDAATIYYRAASEAVTRRRDPYAFLNCLVNLTFADALINGTAESCLPRLASEAADAGLRFVELKARFFQAALAHNSDRSEEAARLLADCIPEQLRLGHLNFLAQELTLDGSLLSTYVTKEDSDTSRKAVLQCVARHWRGPTLLAELIHSGHPQVAIDILALAAGDLTGDAQLQILRSACAASDRTVRRRARILLTSAESRASHPDAPLPELTRREFHVLSRIAAGLDNQAIAAELVLSPTTVKTHINHIFMKLGVSSRVQAILTFQSATPQLSGSATGSLE